MRDAAIACASLFLSPLFSILSIRLELDILAVTSPRRRNVCNMHLSNPLATVTFISFNLPFIRHDRNVASNDHNRLFERRCKYKSKKEFIFEQISFLYEIPFSRKLV